ncbi:hypothetical protein SDC9_88591 [bioreactor metagenome]|uniref:Uncharacterized protein n=1 Tax=bioreactor metagenome TaxID=1076179 RepID=A0A644ZPX8_9ZZZZ
MSRVDIVGGPDARDADGMGTDSLVSLEVLGVHQQADEVVTVEVEPEEHTQSDIVDAAFHSTVHRLGVPGVIVLGTGRMKLFIGLPVIGFLKQNIGADAGGLESGVILDRGSGDVDVDSADGPVLVLDRIDGLDAVKHIFDRIHGRMFAGFQRQAFVAHILKRNGFALDFGRSQLFARDVLVAHVIGAVNTAVDAVVGEVERREHHDPVAVELFLDRPGQGEHRFGFAGKVALEQHRGFAVGQPLALGRPGENGIDQSGVVPVGAGVFQRGGDFGVVDEIGGMGRLDIVHDGPSGLGLMDLFGIDRFDADALDHAETAGERADDAVFGVEHNADDGDMGFAVGNAHAADDMVPVFVEDAVDRFRRLHRLDDDADQGNAFFHVRNPCKKKMFQHRETC